MSLTVRSIQNTSAKNIAFGTKVPKLDVLEVATGKILSSNPSIGRYQRLCKAMTEDSLTNLETIEASKQCQGVLLKEVPALKQISKNADEFFSGETKISIGKVRNWLKTQYDLIGTKGDNYIDVPKFTLDHSKIDNKIAEKLSPDRTFAIVV